MFLSAMRMVHLASVCIKNLSEISNSFLLFIPLFIWRGNSPLESPSMEKALTLPKQ